MKREDNPRADPTEESFDVFMAKTQENPADISADAAPGHPEDNAVSNKPSESDKDSDYGGSDYETGGATTFRMLVEKTQSSDVEFAECCREVGLVGPPTEECCTGADWAVVACRGAGGGPDGACWQCAGCHSPVASLRGPTCWLADAPHVRLKEALLAVYCWTRNYPAALCSHETDLPADTVHLVYDMCRAVASRYFDHEVSNVGGCVRVGLLTFDGLDVLGGIEVSQDSVFLSVMSPSWTRDDLVSAIVDNVRSGSRLKMCDPELERLLGDAGLRYLDRVWAITGDSDCSRADASVDGLSSLWNRYKREHDCYSERSLREFLFRRRMDDSRDPFLYFLAVVSSLYPVEM